MRFFLVTPTLRAFLISATLAGSALAAEPELPTSTATLRKQCIGYGYKAGTDALAECVMKLDLLRGPRQASTPPSPANTAAQSAPATSSQNPTRPSGTAEKANATKDNAAPVAATNTFVLKPIIQTRTLPPYPPASVSLSEQGESLLEVRINSSGAADDCKVIKTSSSDRLDKAACNHVQQFWRWEPLTKSEGKISASTRISIKWDLNASDEPRILLFGTKLISSEPSTAPNGTKCIFSDGEIFIVPPAKKCARDLPLNSVKTDLYNSKRLNIFEQYQLEYKKTKSAETAFNIAAILLANRYVAGLQYLEEASVAGNSLASRLLCAFYANPDSKKYNKYDIKRALDFCAISYTQLYDGMVVALAKSILASNANSLDQEFRSKIEATIIPRDQSFHATRLGPINELIRSSDYPGGARDLGGTTHVIVLVSEQGRVTDCMIAHSSYSYALDSRACQRMREAATYAPAIIQGKSAKEWKDLRVNWHPAADDGSGSKSFLLQLLLGAAIGAALR